MNTKSILKTLLALSISAMMSSCSMIFDGVTGRGLIVGEYIDVTEFYAVDASSSAAVVIVRGDSFEVTLTDYENLLDYWDVKVVNNTLTIRTRPFTSMMNSKAKVTVVMPGELKQLRISGSGNITLDSGFPELEKASISGSGIIRSNVASDYDILVLEITGSGSINLTGTADEVKATTSGSGRMNLNDLTTRRMNCSISGSGNMYVHVTEKLEAAISGSGDIIYSGNPLIDVKSSGSGRLRHR